MGELRTSGRRQRSCVMTARNAAVADVWPTGIASGHLAGIGRANHEDTYRVLVVELEAEPYVEAPRLAALEHVQPDRLALCPIQDRSERLRADSAVLMSRQEQEVLQPELIPIGTERDATNEFTIDADTPRARRIEVAQEASTCPLLIPVSYTHLR